ncbi:SNF2 helicase associated domain-containing protein [Virgibacillus sp. W0430]|uniref:SNF2 helicase associated domain-containing protein n=1 Tax=Virgibacillus sp. W0430 TaxID=3391580 RepID=UPI003F44A7B7
MKTIHEASIQNMFPSLIYKRGLAYYNNDQVSDLLFDINYDVWTATVHGTDTYFVEINMANFHNGTIKAYCDCPAFDTYGSCKHIVAVLIGIAKRSDTVEPAFSYQTTNHFMQAITAAADQRDVDDVLTNKVPMQVEYHCKWTYDETILIELKTGVNRCYVIRDIEHFLKNVMEGREFYFTKKFTYLPESHFFLQQDMDILELLYSFIRNERIYRNSHSLPAFYEKKHGERYIVVPPMFVRQLLEKLVERNVKVEVDDNTYAAIEIEKDTLPFQFSLAKSTNDELLLEMNDVSGMYMKDYELLFSEGVFYFPRREQLPVLEQMAKLGMKDHKLPILKNQADVFLSEVLPLLNEAGDVHIKEEVADEIIHFPLRAKLYLDLKENMIVGDLQYHYGNYEIDPFTGNVDKDVMIIHDTKKENYIMHLIEHANFHYNGTELYIEADEEQLYEFLYTIIPMLDEHVELFLTAGLQALYVEHEPEPQTRVRVESASNLLEIGFDIAGVNDEEVNEMLQAVIEKKRYYRLNSGAIVSLESEGFTSLKQFFTDLDVERRDLDNGSIQMLVYRSTQVDALIDTPKKYDASFRNLLHQLKSPEEQTYPIPENLNASLRSYQQAGYQWFKSLSAYHLGGILADDMGLGKTLQSIAYMVSEPSENPHLVIAPSSVLYNWKNECRKFAPHLEVVVLSGTPEERKNRIEASKSADIWITSYAMVRQDIEQYREVTFQTLILDEAQYIKNYATKTSRAVREVQAHRRFALSGTPIENSIDELWAIFQVVLPGLMPNQRKFKQLAHEKIASITKPFILRRLKEEVLKELPEKIESVHVSELTEDQKNLYVGYLRQLQQEAAESIKEAGFNQNRMKILAGLTRLRQICCHPSLFIENYAGKSGKLEQLMDTIQNSIENGKRMLIFSQFTSMHEIMIAKLKQLNIDYFYLHGGTPSEERVQMSERFNNGEKSVFLISLRAGGTGLNLTGADTVILYDLWWNPAVEDQATGRAHRFGQKNVVHVIRFITEGTIEEKIYQLQQKKRELIDQVIQPGETMLSSLSEEDVRELLSI